MVVTAKKAAGVLVVCGLSSVGIAVCWPPLAEGGSAVAELYNLFQGLWDERWIILV